MTQHTTRVLLVADQGDALVILRDAFTGNTESLRLSLDWVTNLENHNEKSLEENYDLVLIDGRHGDADTHAAHAKIIAGNVPFLLLKAQGAELIENKFELTGSATRKGAVSMHESALLERSIQQTIACYQFLASQEDPLKSLLNHLPTPLVVLSPPSNILFANHAAENVGSDALAEIVFNLELSHKRNWQPISFPAPQAGQGSAWLADVEWQGAAAVLVCLSPVMPDNTSQPTQNTSQTGLAAHAELLAHLHTSINVATNNERYFALLTVNVDDFTTLNTALGFRDGEALLQECARRITDMLSGDHRVVGMSDHALGILTPSFAHAELVQYTAETLLTLADAPFEVNGKTLRLSVSIGIGLFDPHQPVDPDTLVLQSTAAACRAQAIGGNLWQGMTAPVVAEARQCITLQYELSQALAGDTLQLHLQPQVFCTSGQLRGFEASVNWTHEGRGILTPADYLPYVHKSSLNFDLQKWAFSKVCAHYKEYQDTSMAPAIFSVAFSCVQFSRQATIDFILEKLHDTGMPAQQLELSLSDCHWLRTDAAALAGAMTLKKAGVRMALSHFGAKDTSLTDLTQIPANLLKIDASLLKDMTSTPQHAGIVQAILGLAHKLGLQVLAEGVESEAQARFLGRNRCDMLQGNFFSAPLPPDKLQAFLRNFSENDLRKNWHAKQDNTPVVLCVDDEEAILRALKRALRQEGIRVVTANSAREGFELLAIEPVKLVISDQRMPDISGTEFLSRVKELYPDTVRIVLSGYSELAAVTEAVNQGAISKFLLKPWDDDQLRQIIHEALWS